MLDRHEARDNQNSGQPHRDLTEASLADRPLADREVPLPGTADAAVMALNGWLDGDVAESDARRSDTKGVELWTRIASETDRRRRMTTPAHMAGQIMAALPDREVALHTSRHLNTPLVAPSQSSGFSMSTAMLIGAGFAVGIVVGKLVLR